MRVRRIGGIGVAAPVVGAAVRVTVMVKVPWGATVGWTDGALWAVVLPPPQPVAEKRVTAKTASAVAQMSLVGWKSGRSGRNRGRWRTEWAKGEAGDWWSRSGRLGLRRDPDR